MNSLEAQWAKPQTLDLATVAGNAAMKVNKKLFKHFVERCTKFLMHFGSGTNFLVFELWFRRLCL